MRTDWKTEPDEPMNWTRIDTSWGRMHLVWNASGITMLTLPGEAFVPRVLWQGKDNDPFHIATELEAYFDGKLRKFTFPYQLQGSDFQQKVWRMVATIPCGQVRSYGEIAAAIGMPGAMRAVGGANHANPLPLVIPCHRVVLHDGGLGGYRGGTELKRRLLALEGVGGF